MEKDMGGFLGSHYHSHNSLKDRLNRYELAGIKLGSCHAKAWEPTQLPTEYWETSTQRGSGEVWFRLQTWIQIKNNKASVFQRAQCLVSHAPADHFHGC